MWGLLLALVAFVCAQSFANATTTGVSRVTLTGTQSATSNCVHNDANWVEFTAPAVIHPTWIFDRWTIDFDALRPTAAFWEYNGTDNAVVVTSWNGTNWVVDTELVGDSDFFFGESVAIAGQWLIVANATRLHIFRRNAFTGQWNPFQVVDPSSYINRVAIHQDLLVVHVGGGNLDAYRFDGSAWGSVPITNSAWSVYALAIHSGAVVISSLDNDIVTMQRWNGSQFVIEETLSGPDRFGFSVDVHLDSLIVGAASAIASIYRYNATAATWGVPTATFAAPSASTAADASVSIQGDVALLGDGINNYFGAGKGAAFLYYNYGQDNWTRVAEFGNASSTIGGYGKMVALGSTFGLATESTGSDGVVHVFRPFDCTGYTTAISLTQITATNTAITLTNTQLSATGTRISQTDTQVSVTQTEITATASTATHTNSVTGTQTEVTDTATHTNSATEVTRTQTYGTSSGVVLGDLSGMNASCICGGILHSCLVTAEHLIVCFGDEVWGWDHGLLGYANGSRQVLLSPDAALAKFPEGVRASNDSSVPVKLGCGYKHTLVLLSSGYIFGWGRNYEGQMGLGNTTTPLNYIGDDEFPYTVGPATLSGTAKDVCAGRDYSCSVLDAALDGNVQCWGSGAIGRTGYGETVNVGDNELVRDYNPGGRGPFVHVGGSGVALRIYCGWRSTCVLMHNGDLRCWGANFNGEASCIPRAYAPPPPPLTHMYIARHRLDHSRWRRRCHPIARERILDVTRGGHHDQRRLYR